MTSSVSTKISIGGVKEALIGLTSCRLKLASVQPKNITYNCEKDLTLGLDINTSMLRPDF